MKNLIFKKNIVNAIKNIFSLKKYKFLNFSIYKNNYFNKHKMFFKIKDYKLFHFLKYKISIFNSFLISIIVILFIYLFYLSIPSLYDKGRLQKDLSEKLYEEYKVKFSFSSDLKYSILPSPHITIKDAKVFKKDGENIKELIQIRKIKVLISQKNLFNQDNLKIKRLILQNANFTIQKNDFSFFNNLIENKLSKKNFDIKKSTIFYKDYENKIISMFFITNMKLFFNVEKDINEIIANGSFFNTPFSFNVKKNFSGLQNLESFFNFKKLKIKLKKDSFKKDKIYYSSNILDIGNDRLKFKYKIDNKNAFFESDESQLINDKLYYKGDISFDPFYFNTNIVLEKFDIVKFLKNNSTFNEFIKSGLLFNDNISGTLSLKSNNLAKNKLFTSLDALINVKNGEINFDKSKIANSKIGEIVLNYSKLEQENNEVIFKGSFKYIINNQEGFNRFFQRYKKNRILINNIYFDIEYNFFKNRFLISNFYINEAKEFHNNETLEIIKNINDNLSNRSQNWIDFKSLVNQLLISYSG